MRLIGFSSGALAYADFRTGVAMLHKKAVYALELSAMRQAELRPMLDGIDDLDLSQFEYIAFHAPSQFRPEDEESIVDMLGGICDRGWPVILHPDAVHNFSLWRRLGRMLCVENMDKRKPIGRTVSELELVFEQLPDASFCFDIGHARQVDSTMTEAYFILKRFSPSSASASQRGEHAQQARPCLRINTGLQEVASLIPEHVPIILEAPVPEHQIGFEITQVVDNALPYYS